MKKRLLLFSFPFLALHGVELEPFYKIENSVLTNSQGKQFSAIHFDSPLHEDLAYALKDPEQAKIIHDAFLKYFPKGAPESFTKALLKVCYFFGSQKISPEKGFLIALKAEGGSEWAELHRETISLFIQKANRSAHTQRTEKKDQPFTIAILTTSASGGNESVAHGIQHFLSQREDIRVIVIDVETIAKEADPIMLTTGHTTYDGLYASTFQQDEKSEILIERDILSKKLGKYVPSRLGSMLKETILRINPDLILSTRSYTLDDISLATLDIPFRMIHCDYELSFFLMDPYGKADPELMKFWLPSIEPHIFKPLFAKTGRLDLYNETDSHDELMRKVALITGTTPEHIKSQFECIGYPTRPEFRKIDNPDELALLRQKWDIQPDDTPITVSMGKNGVGVLEKIFDQLVQLPPHKTPVKYIFVCGKNEELKNRLEKKLAYRPADQRFAIYGFLPPKEMNELMNISPVKITKPGGAVTTEAFVTGTYLLLMGSHPWEEANGAEAVKMGLGQYYQDTIPLALQIEECIDRARQARKKEIQRPDWQNLLLERIDHKRHAAPLRLCDE